MRHIEQPTKLRFADKEQSPSVRNITGHRPPCMVAGREGFFLFRTSQPAAVAVMTSEPAAKQYSSIRLQGPEVWTQQLHANQSTAKTCHVKEAG
mmetsp:Transcript_12908/g.39014  ORF Transcript_12908/g.39014 Transcript_12908/m.39014 type:complete len:94 (+) Transcript_12908:3070-3351(+)